MADEGMADALNFVMGSRRAASARVIDSLDQDPEKAAEAISLGKATGTDPVLINTDLDYFKRQTKVRATSSLVDSNEYIRDFMARDAMAPKVAHDDVGNLDNLTMNLAKTYLPTIAKGPLYTNLVVGSKLWKLATGAPPPWERGFVSTMLEQNPELMGQFLEGASHGTPELIRQPMLAGSKALIDLSKMSPEEYKIQQKSLWDVGGPLDAMTWFLEQAGSAVGSAAMPMAAGGIGAAAGMPGGPPGMTAGAFLGATSVSYMMNYGEVYKALKDAGVAPEVAQQYATIAAAPMAALDVTGVGVIANRFAKAAAKKEFLDGVVKRAAKEIGIAAGTEGVTEGIQEMVKDLAVSIATDTGFMTKEHAKGWIEAALAGAAGGAVFGTGSAIVGTHQKARPYIDAGVDPPAGLDPNLDKLKAGQTKQDMDKLDGLLRDAKATNLRDRSPEMVSELLRRQLGDTVIEIPAEKIVELYGTKPVTVDDGILGWVTDLEQQLRSTYDQGGFVSIPQRDWLAHVSDEVSDALHDHILPRPTGLTLDEAKVQGKTKAAFDVYHGTPHFFDVFDLQYMGTGEGAQARGAGMYFAQTPAVAKTYARKFDPDTVAGKFERPGQLLRTRIHAELEQFLDLDKPLRDQPLLLEALEKVGVSPADMQLPPAMAKASLRELIAKAPQITGEMAYRALAEKLGGELQASEALKEAGIPGSKFLDQFSRPTGGMVERLPYLRELLARREAEIEKETEKLSSSDPAVVADAEKNLTALISSAADMGAEITGIEKAAEQVTYNIVLFDTALAQIIERNGQVIASTREAAWLGTMTNLGPQAEYLLMQNRLQMQAILDRLDRAETPEEIAALRQEVRKVERVLRSLGKEATGALTEGAWRIEPATEPVTISYGLPELEVMPIGSTSLEDVLGQLDLTDVADFGNLKPILDRITDLAGGVQIHVISDQDMRAILEKAGEDRNVPAYYSYDVVIKGVRRPDNIVMSHSAFLGQYGARFAFHEAVHAATTHAIDSSPALRKTIKDLMDDLKATNPELEEQYGWHDEHEFLTEALSNPEFQKALGSIKLSEKQAKALKMEEWQGKTLWQGIVEFIRFALKVPEGSYTALEAALRVTERAMEVQEEETGLQGAQGKTKEAKQLELPGVTRQEDLDIFEEARSVGLTIDQYIKVMDNIAKRNAEDTEYLLKKVEKFVRKKLTQEWKTEEVKMKLEVSEQLNNRPDIALMTFFRTGRIFGEQIGMPKINPATLTPEQKKMIPDRWLGARGMAAMDAAQLVGYTNVEQMALRVALLNEQMIAAKQPSLRKYVDGLVKAEVERRMVKEHGGLEENILKETQEHIISPTQMDLLHEDTVAMGMANGWEMPFTKAEIIAGVKAGFGKLQAMKVSMEKFLRDAGRAGKLSGIAAEIDKNPTEFFKQRQKQEYSMRYAAEAKKLEKELTSFDNTAGRLSRREARTVDQTYFNYAQDMLEKAGLPVKNSRAELDRSIAFKGHASFDAFMVHEKGKGVDLDLYIPEGYEPKQFDQMTVDEFREFKEVVDTLEMAGRIRRKLHLEGEQRDQEAFEAEVLDHLTQMPIRPDTAGKGRWMYRLDAVWTRMEEIVKDLDLREELGPLWRALIHPFELSKSKKFSMMEDLSKKMKGMMGGDKAWQRTLEDEIPHDFVFDTRNQIFFKLTRWNLIKMMMNVGNESNKAKLARGIASAYVGRVANAEETEIVMNRIDALIDKHANKADWEFVQNIWDIFQGFGEEADTVIRNTMGKVPKWIEATPISNRHGEFAGGYIPLIKDKIRPIEGVEERPDVDVDALMGPDFYRAATSRPHHLERTGAIYFVDITNGIENLAGRMQQHIHDIAFRDFVLNAGKIIYNKKIMSAIEKHYGIEYANQMEPWLKRIANEFTIPEKELGVINDMLRFFRLNLTAAALPLNYAVMYSPGVGTMNVRQMLALGAETQADRKKILANSEELKHVLYTIDRDLTEQLKHVIGGQGAWAKWTSFQRRAVETMFKPLVAMEQETRSVTFYGEFMHQKSLGLTDQEAASLADSVVRERHGAVSPGDLPAMMASNSEFVKIATVFMGYFSMIRNWTRQLPGQYRRGEYANMAKTVWGTVVVAALFNAALFTRRKEDDTLWSFLARAILDTPMSMVPYLREGWGFVTEQRRPTSPIFGMFLASSNLLKDGWNAYQGKEVKHPVKHALSFMGQSVGVPGTIQVGRTAEFLYDVARDKQRPKDFMEWMRGLHTGEAKLRK